MICMETIILEFLEIYAIELADKKAKENMKYCNLGKNGPVVSKIGYGCMGLSSGVYGSTINRKDAIGLIRDIYQNYGVTFFDTADVYGTGHNEDLLGEAIKDFRNKIVLATKCGIFINNDGLLGVNSTHGYIKQSCDASLRRLNTDFIDVYYMHRYNPINSIEEAAGAYQELINEGKIGYVGLSEVKPDIIRRAHSVLGDKLVAIQSEYSIRNPLAGDLTLPICRELGISFVPFSPIGRGFLTGKLTSPKSFGQSQEYDFRKDLPQFQSGNFEQNYALIKALNEFASAKNCTISQLCLAWVLMQDTIPIPGTSNLKHFAENIKALDVKLSVDDLKVIEQIRFDNPQVGERWPEAIMHWHC